MLTGIVASNPGVNPAFTDEFTGTGGTSLNPRWSNIRDTWGLQSNKAVALTTPTTYALATFSANTNSVTIRADGGGTSVGWGTSFWVEDSDNWWAAVVISTNLKLLKSANGVVSEMGSVAIGDTSAGIQYIQVVTNSAGKITATAKKASDDVVQIQQTPTAPTRATKHGIVVNAVSVPIESFVYSPVALDTPTVTIASVVTYDQTTAVLRGTVNTTGGTNITTVQFQYSTSSTFASGNSAWFTASTNATIASGATDTLCTYNATGLSNGVTYYVQFKATNSVGIATSGITSFTTLSVPKTAPTSLSAAPSTTSVAISFTAPTDVGTSAITNYEYSFNNSSWTALSPADAVSPVTIGSLSPYVAYSIYLRAVNSVGPGPASTAVTFTTLSAPSATINAVTNFTESIATLNATISANGTSTEVYFQYNTTNTFNSPGDYTQVYAGTVTTQSAAKSAYPTLPKNTALNGNGYLFYVRVVAVNANGTTTSGVTSFRSWGKKEYNERTPGTHYFTVPTVGGTYPHPLPEVYLIGSGGGGAWAGSGGGAGGLVTRTNVAFLAADGALTINVGYPGAGGYNTTYTTGTYDPALSPGAPGGACFFSGPQFVQIAAGGGGGGTVDGPGGNVGYGDNPAYTGGTTAFYYAGKTTYKASGGGAGNDGNGGNGSAPSTNAVSGNGGPGNGFWGNAGGGGGGSNATQGANGSPYNIGAGGAGGMGAFQVGQPGVVGIVYFTYYGP
jgi:hypothetical protein